MERLAAVYRYLWVSTLQPETIRQVLRSWTGMAPKFECFTNSQELSRGVPQSLLMMGQTDFGESDVKNPIKTQR